MPRQGEVRSVSATATPERNTKRMHRGKKVVQDEFLEGGKQNENYKDQEHTEIIQHG